VIRYRAPALFEWFILSNFSSRRFRSCSDFSAGSPADLLAPIISNVISATSPACAANPSSLLVLDDCPRRGGTVITLQGNHFGDSGAFVSIGTDPCLNVTHSTTSAYTQLTCLLGQGPGQDRPIIVFQKNGRQSRSPSKLNYKLCPPGTFESGLNCPNCSGKLACSGHWPISQLGPCVSLCSWFLQWLFWRAVLPALSTGHGCWRWQQRLFDVLEGPIQRRTQQPMYSVRSWNVC
jgi:hypothetical protein